jgi:hypothetical protein
MYWPSTSSDGDSFSEKWTWALDPDVVLSKDPEGITPQVVGFQTAAECSPW